MAAAKPKRRTDRSDAAAIRICLGALALSALAIGLPAAFAPETFYTEYPFFTALVKLLPPYNEHLITDIGGLYLGFAVMFGWATLRPSRQLILPLCAAWIITQTIHFAFHIDNLTGFTTTEAFTQQLGLGIYIVLALVPVAMLRRG